MTQSASWQEVAADLWSSVGMEIIIFAITLFFALAISISGRKAAYTGKRKKNAGAGDDAAVAVRAKDAAQAAVGFAEKSATRGGSAHQRQAPQAQPSAGRSAAAASLGRLQQRCGGLAEDARQPKTVPQLIDEIVEGVKEKQSMKFASRTLGLYAEVRTRLAAGQPPLAEVARNTRHPMIEVYTTVVQCAVRLGRFELVDTVIKDMIQQDVERSMAFYEIAMKQLAGQRQYRLALAVYDRLSADGLKPSVVTCSCLIGFAAEVGEYQRAVEFFNMLASMTTPSIRAYMTVLRVHAKRQDWPSSLATFRNMQTRGVRPDSLVLNFVLATGIAADQVEAANALVDELASEAPQIPDVVSYNTLIKGHAQRGDADAALRALGLMKSRGLSPNSITFNTAMDAAVRGGAYEQAWRLLATMRGAGLRPDKFTSSILIKGLTKGAATSHIQSALELLREVGAACDGSLLSTLYHTVLDAAASVADAELTAKTLSQMRGCNVKPSPSAHQLLALVLPPAEMKSIATEIAKVMA